MNNVNDRDLVLPGQLIGENLRCDNSCRTENGKTYSLVKGLARFEENGVSVIPLDGAYMPKVGDVVVGVIDTDFGGVYAVDIKAPYKCILRPPKDMDSRGGRGGGPRRDEGPKETYNVGDLISAKISSVDEIKEAQLTGPLRLDSGYVISVKPKRVPRIIGKKRSMIDLIRQYSGSRIVVGQNGLVWFKEGNLPLAVDAIKKVEAEAHTTGLTNRMAEFLKSGSKL
ncbi:MAG: KH domain-containing protein [Candidatus Altiarchaeota archaeon]